MTKTSFPAAGVSLRDLLTADHGGAGVPNLRITSCTSDSRQVQPGDVYVALVEADRDGHDDAAEAARRGAVAVICEQPVPVFNVPQVVVPSTRDVYGRLCHALMGNPAQLLKVIGITGSHGKTTVARLLSSILRETGQTVGTLDSFGYWDGWEAEPPTGSSLTVPKLARSLAQMAAGGASHAVVELSSRELCEHVLAGVTLDVACITHIGRRHLGWHGSLDKYRQAKRRVFDHLAAEGVAVLNADDPTSTRLLCDLQQPALTFGISRPAEVTAHVIEQHANEQIFLLSAGDESVGVRTAIIGDHHVSNCLAAATAALAYGVELTAIARGLEAVDQLPGYMERIACGQNFAVFLDAADSPDALRAALRAARQVTGGRVICVVNADTSADRSERQVTGRVAGAIADQTVVTSSRHGVLERGACRHVAGGLADRRKGQIIEERAEAIMEALSLAEPGDAVVITGANVRSGDGGRPDSDAIDDVAVVRRQLADPGRALQRPRLAA